MYDKNAIFRLLFISCLLLKATEGFSQDKSAVELLPHSFNVNLLSPGIQYEARLSTNKSLVLEGFLSTSSFYNSGDGFDSVIRPTIGAQYRSYYKRKKQKKDFQSNSGNYIGAILGYQGDELITNSERKTFNNRLMGGAVWGIQRRFQSNIHLGLQTGVVMTYDDYLGISWDVVARVQLGWIIK